MKDNLNYRLADEGGPAFKRACREAQKWIDDNANGPVKLRFAISLGLSAAETGESVIDMMKTPPLELNGNEAPRRRRRSVREELEDSTSVEGD